LEGRCIHGQSADAVRKGRIDVSCSQQMVAAAVIVGDVESGGVAYLLIEAELAANVIRRDKVCRSGANDAVERSARRKAAGERIAKDRIRNDGLNLRRPIIPQGVLVRTQSESGLGVDNAGARAEHSVRTDLVVQGGPGAEIVVIVQVRLRLISQADL